VADVRNPEGDGYLDIARVRRLIAGSGCAAVLAVSPENVTYLSGCAHPDPWVLPDRPRAVVWPASGDPVFIVPNARAPYWTGHGGQSVLRYEETRPLIKDVRPYAGGQLDLVRVAVEALTELGVRDAVLGVELDNLPVRVSRELSRLLPTVRQEDARPLLEAMRAIKSPAEVAVLTEVNRATAECLELVLSSVWPGETELQIAARVASALWERGAHACTHTTLATGRRSTGRHPVPSGQPVERGMLIRTNWGIRIDGYGSDIARNGVVGLAGATQRDRFARISEAHDSIVDAIRPGVLASELCAMARREYTRLRLDHDWAGVGHGIGLLGYEAPLLLPDVHEPVLEGMTLEIELGYVGDDEVYHIGDLVHVTSDGAVNITQRLPGRSLIESQF
jgi:Xaa-Pro aminopeptidase